MKEDANDTMVRRDAVWPTVCTLGLYSAVFRDYLFSVQGILCVLIHGDDEGQAEASSRRTRLWRDRVNQGSTEVAPASGESTLKVNVGEEDGDGEGGSGEVDERRRAVRIIGDCGLAKDTGRNGLWFEGDGIALKIAHNCVRNGCGLAGSGVMNNEKTHGVPVRERRVGEHGNS